MPIFKTLPNKTKEEVVADINAFFEEKGTTDNIYFHNWIFSPGDINKHFAEYKLIGEIWYDTVHITYFPDEDGECLIYRVNLSLINHDKFED